MFGVEFQQPTFVESCCWMQQITWNGKSRWTKPWYGCKNYYLHMAGSAYKMYLVWKASVSFLVCEHFITLTILWPLLLICLSRLQNKDYTQISGFGNTYRVRGGAKCCSLLTEAYLVCLWLLVEILHSVLKMWEMNPVVQTFGKVALLVPTHFGWHKHKQRNKIILCIAH